MLATGVAPPSPSHPFLVLPNPQLCSRCFPSSPLCLAQIDTKDVKFTAALKGLVELPELPEAPPDFVVLGPNEQPHPPLAAVHVPRVAYDDGEDER